MSPIIAADTLRKEVEVGHPTDVDVAEFGLRVVPDPDSWTVLVDAGYFGDVGIKGISMFMRPFDLRPATLEPLIHEAAQFTK